MLGVGRGVVTGCAKFRSGGITMRMPVHAEMLGGEGGVSKNVSIAHVADNVREPHAWGGVYDPPPPS